MISPVSRFLILAISLLSYLSVHAGSVPNTKPDYLVSFSSSATSEVRPSPESLPCQGLLLSSGHVATAPACAKTITEQVSMGGTVNLIDNSRQSIGHLSVINTDETAKGILSVSWDQSGSQNSLISVTGLGVSGNEPQAYFLQQGESVTFGHVTVRLGDVEVKQGVPFQPLHSDTNLPPGSPVISGNKVICLTDGSGACVQNIHKQATHISKRSAISKRQSRGSATGCTFSGQSVLGIDNGVWTCSDCSDCGCSGGCRITDKQAAGFEQSTCTCNSGGSCGISQGGSGDACTATGGAASLTAGIFSLLVVAVAAISASL
ncbi:MAG: hypothetical protein ACR2PX_23195 [Endozoicomonas sp.]|uniref:hypothetical protein n=1 Tax=Endozoicomonas sp. TaxID=1892382 RepID=UPI003D9B8435